MEEDDLEFYVKEDREEEIQRTDKSVAQIQMQVQQMLRKHYGKGESLDSKEIKELVLQVTNLSKVQLI